MNVNRNAPTLSGQHNESYDAVKTTTLACTGSASVGGSLIATGLSGACISDSLVLSSSTTAGSAAGLSNVAARLAGLDYTHGGTMAGALTVTGQLTTSNLTVLGDKEIIYSYETHTSNVYINSLGQGPALVVRQDETTGYGAVNCAEFWTNNGGSYHIGLAIGMNGAVGCGTTSPAQPFHVAGDSALAGLVAVNQVSVTSGYKLDVSGAIRATGAIVSTSGNCGIGSTAPAYALDVSGVVRATGGFLGAGVGGSSQWTTSNANVYILGSNVGVGTTVPAYALDVSGNIRGNGVISSRTGTVARQFDCGSSFMSGTSSPVRVSFNFTFNNIPSVCVTMSPGWGNNLLCSVVAYNIDATGFSTNGAYYTGGTMYTYAAVHGFSWIAVG